jgi:hypothetical protein
VFNAYAELHDPSAKNFEPEVTKPRALTEERDAAHTAPAAATSPTPPPTPTVALPTPPAVAQAPSPTAIAPGERNPTAESIGAASLADVVAETKVAAADSEQPNALGTDGAFDSDLTATEVERVLTSNAGPPLPQSAYVWPTAATSGAGRGGSRWWSAAAALALLALGVQAIHHYRSELASHPTFGPWISQVYAALGGEIAPNWDVRQYQIIDWVASAEPNSRGVGSLKITARIQNRGPLRQPYPAVQLRLKDRYEEAVGSRMFTPAEYLPRDMPRGRLMAPGETARAELEVVDPGPDAYGFELDVCIEVEASLVTCGTDEVFL